jgi:subtilisin family serine protease
MRPAFTDEFTDPALAAQLGLDRTYIIEVPPGTDTPRMAAAFAELQDEIELVTTDTIGGVAGMIPIDSQFGSQYALHNTGQFIQGQAGTPDADLDAPEAWELHTGEPGTVTLAIIDSGVNPHSEFVSRMVPGRNTNNPLTPTLTTDGCPHGTHVAGIAAAGGNNYRCSTGSVNFGAVCDEHSDCQRACLGGPRAGLSCTSNADCPSSTCASPICTVAGVAGVTWGANIMPVRVLNGCFGNVSQLADGFRWAADHGADIGNMSLQYYNLSQAEYNLLSAAVNYAHGCGMLLVAAAGNNNIGPPNPYVAYPGRLVNCMAVSATDNRDLFAAFSRYGNEVDVCAPGDDIYSTWTSDGYTYLYGTSMAAPHVSGLAALVLSYAPGLTNVHLELILMQSADDKGPPGRDPQYGAGRVNAYNALLLAEDYFDVLLYSDPPDGAIDARKPTDPNGSNPYGWDAVDLTFGRITFDPAIEDFTVSQDGGVSAPPTVAGVSTISSAVLPVDLDVPIETKAWTTIAHPLTGATVRLGYLPADANGDGTSNEDDVAALVAALDPATAAAPTEIWSRDIDRSNLFTPADVLEAVDLLNGADGYDPFLNEELP